MQSFDTDTKPDDDVEQERGAERYAAFGIQMRQLFLVKARALKTKAMVVGAKAKAAAAANARYTAYASDVGEGLRPVVSEWAVKASYGLAITCETRWIQTQTDRSLEPCCQHTCLRHVTPPLNAPAPDVGGEVGLHTYNEAQVPGGNPARVLAHQSVFHGIASLGLPMLIIHQTVHAAQIAAKRIGRFTRWGPSIAGLALIPALPFAVDAPVEAAVDAAFDYGWPCDQPKKHGHEH